MTAPSRTVFYVSDGTGITAETLGHALLAQFEGVKFREIARPFVNAPDQVVRVAEEIDAMCERDGVRPIVFSTLVDMESSALLHKTQAQVHDLFGAFLKPLEEELDQSSAHALKRTHSIFNRRSYLVRMDAVNFTLAHDDGAALRNYANADVILTGVSRSGKTPTCIYLSMQFGVKAANYPITEEDLESAGLPNALKAHRHKLFGLTIDPEQLASIREERKPNSRYASLSLCRREVDDVRALFTRFRVPYLDTTAVSVEEISSKLLQVMNLERRLF
jgi:[pyruvate, water dikinase]-phosphate phosphotransferase / [pyruvate, water dikinase] kinase